MEPKDAISAPPYLAQVLIREGERPRRTEGSGVLLAGTWLLSAKHVLKGRRKGNQPYRETPMGNLSVRCGGQESGIAEIVPHPRADLALARLTNALPGPYAPLVTGLLRNQPDPRAHPRLIYFGYRGEAGPDDGPSSSGWDTYYRPHWSERSGELEDIQLPGGAPRGISGGVLCVEIDGGLGVAGVAYLGGEESFSTRAYAVPWFLDLLGPVDWLKLVEWRGAQPKDDRRLLRGESVRLLQDALVGWCQDRQVLLADAFSGEANDPRGDLEPSGTPATVAARWVDQLMPYQRLGNRRKPLAQLLDVAYRKHHPPRTEVPGGFDALLVRLDADG